jgi:hypothetical protein
MAERRITEWSCDRCNEGVTITARQEQQGWARMKLEVINGSHESFNLRGDDEHGIHLCPKCQRGLAAWWKIEPEKSHG